MFSFSNDSLIKETMPKTSTKTLSTSKTTKKRSKDPNAPKRFRTAYLLFSSEKREEVKVNSFIQLGRKTIRIDVFFQKENPTLSAKEIMAELAAQWKSADAAVRFHHDPSSFERKIGFFSEFQTKQRFQKLSDAEKNEYEEKMAAYKGEKHDKQSANKENLKKSKSKSSKKQKNEDDDDDDDGNDLSMEE